MSGEQVRDSRPLVWFLYILMRDRLTSGSVYEIIEKHCRRSPAAERLFSNPHLARMAQEIAEELTERGTDGMAEG